MAIINELQDIGYSKLVAMIQNGEISSANKAFSHICNHGPALDSLEAIQASRRAISLVTRYYDRDVEARALIIIVSNYKLDQNNNISTFKIGHISVRPVSFLVALTASYKIVNLADKEDDLDMRKVEILDAMGRVLYSDDIELTKGEKKEGSMPDKKDIEYITSDLMLKISEAEDLCQGLIETAQEYNTQEDQQIYDIAKMKTRLEKIRSIQ